MGKVVTGRYKDLRESHFRELRKKIETDLEIRGSTRVEDVVDNFSTMLEGVLAGNSPIGPKR
jgi:hypothetical protein